VLHDHAAIVEKINDGKVIAPPQIAPEQESASGYRMAEQSAGERPIIVEGSFFRMNENGGISRVWKEIFKKWSGTPFGDRIIFLDRAGTAPRIEGIRKVTIEPYYLEGGITNQRKLMQRYCDHFGAGAFISTYYSAAETTPTVMLVHDMIPERLPELFDSQDDMWREKDDLIGRAKRFVCVSENTRKDLLELCPKVAPGLVSVARPAACATFGPRSDKEVQAVLRRLSIDRPYLLFVGIRQSYKNAWGLIEAWKYLPETDRPLIVFVGGDGVENEIKAELEGHYHHVKADDDVLAALYSGALAFVFPSLYEGFGLPVLEAMACGCPVICSNASSLPEVAGGAALLVSPQNLMSMSAAILRVQQPAVRQRLITAGFERVAMFSWDTLADELRTILETLAAETPVP
jgi:glycosyltransferase involved in cell wall biosynthesis